MGKKGSRKMVQVCKPLALSYEEGRFVKGKMKLVKGKYGPMTNRYVPVDE